MGTVDLFKFYWGDGDAYKMSWWGTTDLRQGMHQYVYVLNHKTCEIEAFQMRHEGEWQSVGIQDVMELGWMRYNSIIDEWEVTEELDYGGV